MKAVLEDKSVFVRHESLLALGTLGDKKFVLFVKKFVNDKDPNICESAQIALERIKSS